jgi:mannitol-1-phosphate 5-dehydrogenase
MSKKVIIWGAGKIGRGFIGDLFHAAGYSIVFIARNKLVVKRLNEQKEYTVYKYKTDGTSEQTVVSGYTALHTSETDDIISEMNDCDIMALSVLPKDVGGFADDLVHIIRHRIKVHAHKPLDIIVCANIIDPSEELRAIIEPKLTESEKAYIEKYVGLVDALINRAALDPSEDILKEDPLAVVTNGYPDLPIDKMAFKGDIPQFKGIVQADNLHALALRKFYTYNMVHALLAYIGYYKGYQSISESLKDEEILQTAKGALEEIGEALVAAFGFKDMDEWNWSAFAVFGNAALQDPVERVGADPIRKLSRSDRLIGPVLLCKEYGIWPYYLTNAIAHAFLFGPESDPNALLVKEYAQYYGIKEAARKYCGLDMEPEILQLIKRHYDRALQNESPEDADKVKTMKDAYHQGFMSEKTYKGCAQCTLDAMFKLTGKTNEMVFQCASGFSGGMAISGDGVCGGYSGGLMFMGSLVGRRYKEMLENGDKDAQYMSYTMAQTLRDRFLETYGSVICSDVHKQIFGKSFCLRTKAMRNDFEAVGAHTTKCTNVVGTASAYIAEILYDEGYLKTI